MRPVPVRPESPRILIQVSACHVSSAKLDSLSKTGPDHSVTLRRWVHTWGGGGGAGRGRGWQPSSTSDHAIGSDPTSTLHMGWCARTLFPSPPPAAKLLCSPPLSEPTCGPYVRRPKAVLSLVKTFSTAYMRHQHEPPPDALPSARLYVSLTFASQPPLDRFPVKGLPSARQTNRYITSHKAQKHHPPSIVRNIGHISLNHALTLATLAHARTRLHPAIDSNLQDCHNER